jgi:hypothetical protein
LPFARSKIDQCEVLHAGPPRQRLWMMTQVLPHDR